MPTVRVRPGVHGAATAIVVFWFGWGAVFSSRPERSQTTGAVAVKDGLVLPRPPRAYAARSVLEGGPAPEQNMAEPKYPLYYLNYVIKKEFQS
jgi:hypothetical protein